MQNAVSAASILAMGGAALVGLLVPAALYAVFRKKGAKQLPFWVGCAVFVLFALVLEQIAYYFLRRLPLWTAIMGNLWLLGLVGGLFAGVFEEAGRFIAFRTVLRRQRGNDCNVLMYGAGHGGIEAVALLSVSMVANIIAALQFNAGAASMLGGLDAAQVLLDTPWWMFLVGAVERIAAIAIHLSLSVLVWFAAKDKKRFWLFPLAILLHLFVDAVAVILSGAGANVWLIEGVVYVMAAALALLAVAIWRGNHAAPLDERSPEA